RERNGVIPSEARDLHFAHAHRSSPIRGNALYERCTNIGASHERHVSCGVQERNLVGGFLACSNELRDGGRTIRIRACDGLQLTSKRRICANRTMSEHEQSGCSVVRTLHNQRRTLPPIELT